MHTLNKEGTDCGSDERKLHSKESVDTRAQVCLFQLVTIVDSCSGCILQTGSVMLILQFSALNAYFKSSYPQKSKRKVNTLLSMFFISYFHMSLMITHIKIQCPLLYLQKCKKDFKKSARRRARTHDSAKCKK